MISIFYDKKQFFLESNDNIYIMYSKKELLYDCGGRNESDFSIENYTYKINRYTIKFIDSNFQIIEKYKNMKLTKIYS